MFYKNKGIWQVIFKKQFLKIKNKKLVWINWFQNYFLFCKNIVNLIYIILLNLIQVLLKIKIFFVITNKLK